MMARLAREPCRFSRGGPLETRDAADLLVARFNRNAAAIDQFAKFGARGIGRIERHRLGQRHDIFLSRSGRTDRKGDKRE